MKRSCVDCHFLVKWQPGGIDPRLEIADADYRERLRAGDWKSDRSTKEQWHYALSCHKAVWHETRDFPIERWREEIVERDRGEECYFRAYVPGMALPAAVALEEREYEAREAGKGLDLTRKSIEMAASGLDLTRKSVNWAIGGLIATVILEIVQIAVDLSKSK